MKALDDVKDAVKDFKMPDMAGMDGDTIQTVLVVIVGLWLFMKLKKLFFLFAFAAMIYYMLMYT